MTNIEQEIVQIVHVLPVQEQAKVLEYVKDLERRLEGNGKTETDQDAETKARIERVMQLKGINSKSGNVSEIKSFNEAETQNGTQPKQELSAEEKHALRMSLVGIGRSGKGDVSERVDEILAEGINKREGWSFP